MLIPCMILSKCKVTFSLLYRISQSASSTFNCVLNNLSDNGWVLWKYSECPSPSPIPYYYLQEVGIQHLRVIPSREVKDVVCDVEKQLDTAARTSQQQTRAEEPIRQRDQGQQQRVQPEQLIRQAVMGTAFLGSLIASVINVLQHHWKVKSSK